MSSSDSLLNTSKSIPSSIVSSRSASVDGRIPCELVFCVGNVGLDMEIETQQVQGLWKPC